MCFLGDRTVAHGTGLESLNDLGCRLNFLERNGIAGLLECEEASSCMGLLVVNDCRVLLEELVRTFSYCLLEGNDGFRIV